MQEAAAHHRSPLVPYQQLNGHHEDQYYDHNHGAFDHDLAGEAHRPAHMYAAPSPYQAAEPPPTMSHVPSQQQVVGAGPHAYGDDPIHPHPHNPAAAYPPYVDQSRQQHHSGYTDIAFAPWNPIDKSGGQIVSPETIAEHFGPVANPHVPWTMSTSFSDSAGLYGSDPSLHLRLQSFPVLDSLASQIIASIAHAPSLDVIEQLVYGDEHEAKQAFIACKNLFEQTRKVYVKDSPLIDARAFHALDSVQHDTILRANRATYISSLLQQSQDIPLHDLHSSFLGIFSPSASDLSEWQSDILVDMKTQLYISYLSHGPLDTVAMLAEIFPSDISHLTRQHLDPSMLTVTQQALVHKAAQRRQMLQALPYDIALRMLPYQFPWRAFLEQFAAHVKKNAMWLLAPAGSVASGPRGAEAHVERSIPVRSPIQSDASPHSLTQSPSIHQRGCPPGGGYSNFGAFLPKLPHQVSPYHNQGDHNAPPSPRSHSSTRSPDMTLGIQSPASTRRGSSTTPAQANKPVTIAANKRSSRDDTAATTAGSAGGGSGGGAGGSTRQPWKPEEEAALLQGLAEVKGPHWSRILTLYGRGGTRNDVLRDRNQIQLKDKARNLKLAYLKSGVDPPPQLAGVTGTLRKRGGVRFRRAEAEQQGKASAGVGTAEEGDKEEGEEDAEGERG